MEGKEIQTVMRSLHTYQDGSYQKDNKMKFMPHDGWAAHNFVFL